MTKYELLYIISSDYTDNEIGVIQKQVAEIIAKEGGTITRDESLGKIKLAYPIKKSKHGTYILVHFDSEPDKIASLDRILRLTDEVLRHQIIIMPEGTAEAPVEIHSYVVPLSEEAKKSKIKQPVATPSPKPKQATPATPVVQDDTQSMSMEELDKKLDEILEKDITIDS